MCVFWEMALFGVCVCFFFFNRFKCEGFLLDL